MSNSTDKELREILGEEDWRYTDKPHRIQALINKAVVAELKMVLEAYRDNYQDIAKENGVDRKTPHTIFHQIIETRVSALTKKGQEDE